MRRIFLFVLLGLPAPIYAAESSTDMWGCAPLGERRNVLFLVDRGVRSYVKFGSQRVPAQISTADDGRRWSWGNNAIVLTEENIADYYEGDSLKGKFRCKAVN